MTPVVNYLTDCRVALRTADAGRASPIKRALMYRSTNATAPAGRLSPRKSAAPAAADDQRRRNRMFGVHRRLTTALPTSTGRNPAPPHQRRDIAAPNAALT